MGPHGLAGKTRTVRAAEETRIVDVSVIIVNYNVREFLEQALRSVEAASDSLSVEVFVVDNNSADGSVDMLRTKFSTVRVIANDENLGFARANNQAIREASGRYLLILNPDTIVAEDTLRTLVDFMDIHPEAGAAGCRILGPDGSFAPESRRSFPTPLVAFYRMVKLSSLFPRSRLFGKYNLTYLPIDEVTEVDALSGSCMLVRHEALYHKRTLPHVNGQTTESGGAGLFDEGFFMYGEDLDWCYRIQQAGWKILYTPDTCIIHYKGASTTKSEVRYVKLFYGAMLRFAEKHLHHSYPRPVLWLLRLAVVVHGSCAALGNALKRLAPPIVDFAISWGVVVGLGELREAQSGVTFSGLFSFVIAPGFALIATAVIATLGGYKGHRRRVGPVWLGVAAAFLFLAAVSFFVRNIAFSRAVVLASLPAGAFALSAVRLLRRVRRRGFGRTVLVGSALEATRFRRCMDADGPRPSIFVGYVSPNKSDDETGCLGRLHHLRDIVLLRGIKDVIFGTAQLSDPLIFTLMQRLQGLPVRVHLLRPHTKDPDQVRLVHAEDALGVLRSPTARRLFGGFVALLAGMVNPIICRLAHRAGKGSVWSAIAQRTSQWKDVLAGRRHLVGYFHDDGFDPPTEWQLQPGVFSVTETGGRMTAEEAERAYWFYVRNQNAVLDWIVMVRAIRIAT